MKNENIRKPVVNHINHTISVSDSFLRAAADPTTNEFELFMRLTAACPNYKVVTIKRRKAKKKAQPKLTYAKMGKYIACLRDADELMEVFEKVKAFAKSQPNPYLMVSRWFFESFPDYGCQPDFDEDGFPIVEANCVSLEAFKQRNEAAKQQNEAKSQQEQSATEQLGA